MKSEPKYKYFYHSEQMLLSKELVKPEPVPVVKP